MNLRTLVVPSRCLERGLGTLHWVVGLALLAPLGFLAIWMLVLVFPGFGGGAGGGFGWFIAGGGIDSFALAAVVLTPVSLWLFVVGWWLWRGNPRGRTQSVVIGLIAAALTGLAIVELVVALFREMPSPLAPAVLLVTYAWINLLVGLRAPFWKTAATFGFVAAVVLSTGLAGARAFLAQSQTGNPGRIRCPSEFNGVALLALTSGGDLIAAGQQDSDPRPGKRQQRSDSQPHCSLLVWDFNSGRLKHRILVPGKSALDCNNRSQWELSGDGRYYVAIDDTSGYDWPVRVFDLVSGKKYLDLPRTVRSSDDPRVIFSQKSDFLAVVSQVRHWESNGTYFVCRCEVWDLGGKRMVHSLQTKRMQDTFRAFAIDASGQILAAASRDRVALWDLKSSDPQPRWELPLRGTRGLFYRNGENRLLALAEDMTQTSLDMITIDTRTGQEQARWRVNDIRITNFDPQQLSANGKFLTAPVFGEVRIWDTTTGELVRKISYTTTVKARSAVNLDTMRLACPTINDKSRWIERWDLDRERELKEFQEP